MNRPAPSAVVLALLCLAGSAESAQDGSPAPYRSPAEILAASPATDWRQPDPENLLYLELARGRVIIELAPAFAPAHVANIRALARSRFWDGLAFYRAQDNFVVQFGDADGDDPKKARPLGSARPQLPAEFRRDSAGLAFERLPDADGWAPEVGFVDGFPVARDPRAGHAWLAHCYGAVGAGRGNADDSSTGAELYVVIGQSPRQIDNNITVVGRVLLGMEWLSTLRRGPPPLGFYEQARERTPIRSIRVAADVPERQRTRLEVLRTDSRTFRDATEARRNRVDDFYKRPAGHIDLCNVPVPVRLTETP